MTETLEGGRIMDPETGLIFPWYTSTCLEWLKTLDLKGKFVYEYGLGDSTTWYKNKGAICAGVDHNLSFVPKYKGSSFMVALTTESYTRRSITRFVELFDIIIIDGIHRDECTKPALKKLKPGGSLIIDNYKQKSADLEHWPLTEKLIEGMPITIYKEPNHEDWQTAVITKP